MIVSFNLRSRGKCLRRLWASHTSLTLTSANTGSSSIPLPVASCRLPPLHFAMAVALVKAVWDQQVELDPWGIRCAVELANQEVGWCGDEGREQKAKNRWKFGIFNSHELLDPLLIKPHLQSPTPHSLNPLPYYTASFSPGLQLHIPSRHNRR